MLFLKKYKAPYWHLLFVGILFLPFFHSSLSASIFKDIALIAAMGVGLGVVVVAKTAFTIGKYLLIASLLSFSPKKPMTPVVHKQPMGSIEQFSNALAKEGMQQYVSGGGRLWITPFATLSNNSAYGLRGSGCGFLLGTEYNNVNHGFTVGLMGGLQKNLQKSSAVDSQKTDLRGFVLGTYGHKNLWEGGRIEGMYIYNNSSLRSARLDANNAVVAADTRSKIHMVDTLLNHVHRFNDVWSIRGSVGHTYQFVRSGALKYSDLDIGERNAITQEIYPGVGVRWNHLTDSLRTRVTAIYEYGYEYRHDGFASTISQGGVLVPVNQKQSKARTHYVTVTASFLTLNKQEKNAWKFLVSYSGSYAKRSQNHTIMTNFEYRF
ncbi:MAG: hypothetical protein CNLJKLNK_00848 [Holosporales bacterium]